MLQKVWSLGRPIVPCWQRNRTLSGCWAVWQRLVLFCSVLYSTYLSTSLPLYLYVPTYLFTYLPTYLPTYLRMSPSLPPPSSPCLPPSLPLSVSFSLSQALSCPAAMPKSWALKSHRSPLPTKRSMVMNLLSISSKSEMKEFGPKRPQKKDPTNHGFWNPHLVL